VTSPPVERLAAAVVRFRVPVVAFWAAVLVVAMVTLPGLGSEVNSDPSLFLSASARSVRAAALATPLPDRTARSKVSIVAARAGGLAAPDLAAIRRDVRLVRGLDAVLSVREGAISPGEKAVQLDVYVARDSKDAAGLRPVVNAIRATFADAGPPAGLQLHLAGTVATNLAGNASANRSMRVVGLASIVLIIVLLLVILRSAIAAVVTFLPSVVALLVSQKLVAGLGEHGVQISSVTQTLLIVLLLGAGTDYGLFLVYRFREELRAGTEPHAAVVRALRRVAGTVGASAGTVILALLTLLFAGFGLYRDLAVPLALGLVVMLLVGLTLLPALLALVAGLAFPGVRPVEAGESPADGWWGRIAARAVRRPARTLAAGVLVFGVLAVAALGYRTASIDRSATAPAGSDAAAGDALVARYFPQSAANPADLILRYRTPVWRDPEPMATANASLTASGLFTTLAGPLDPNGTRLAPRTFAALHTRLGDPRRLPLVEPPGLSVPRGVYNAYRATSQYVGGDGRTVRLAATLRAGSQQSTAAMDATPAVRAAVAEAAHRSGAVDSGVTGRAASFYDVSRTAGGDMVLIIPLAVLAIAILLGLVLRSLVAPLYLVVSIVLSYLAALGLTTLLVIGLAGQDGLVFALPFLMFVFLLALGEDYNILVMNRIREEARTLPVREAVVRAVGRTGPTVTAAGMILAGTFGVFAVAGDGIMGGQLRAVGLGLALGILLDTFGVRTLLVPSAAVLLDRWNWWPSRLGRPLP
jgi:putative drug exporter of the RND superfamily